MSFVQTLRFVFLEFFLNFLNTAHFFFVFTDRLIMTCWGGAMILFFGDFEVGGHEKNSYNVLTIMPLRA